MFVLTAASLMASDLAPTGTLRATFLGANPVQGHVDAQTGAITGPVADIVKEMARKLGVPYTITPASGAAGVIALIKAHKADIGFLAYDEARAKEVDFAGSYALMYNTYVVAADSPIKTAADADRPGVKIGAVRGQTQELYLSANIKQGEVKDLRVATAASRSSNGCCSAANCRLSGPIASAWKMPPRSPPSCARLRITF